MSQKKVKKCNDFICSFCKRYYGCKLVSKTNPNARRHMKECKRENFKYWEFNFVRPKLLIYQHTIKDLKDYFYSHY